MESTNAEQPPGLATSNDEITEEEFDQLLAELASEGPSPAPADASADATQPEVAAQPAQPPEPGESGLDAGTGEEAADEGAQAEKAPQAEVALAPVDEPIVVVLDEAPSFANVGALYGELGEVKDSAEKVTVDLSRVQTIDVATLQCLYGFVTHRGGAGLSTELSQPSDAFSQVAVRLGLAETLAPEEVART